MPMNFLEELKNVLVFDGATGTMLQKLGLKPGAVLTNSYSRTRDG